MICSLGAPRGGRDTKNVIMTEEQKRRFDAELEEIRATISKLNAETAKLATETRYPPVIVAAMIIGVVSPLLTVILAVFGR